MTHQPPSPAAGQAAWFGVYPAIVVDVTDPDGQGRVRVQLPWSPDTAGESYEAWARIATLMAGDNRGTWFVPEVGDEVLVAFEAGKPSRPYLVGALWNGGDRPPQTMDDEGDNNLRSIHSRSGMSIEFDDTAGSERLTLETAAGQRVVLDNGAATVEVRDGNGNTATFNPTGVNVEAATDVTVTATRVEISAATVSVDAADANFSGVVRADTVITNLVVSNSYTPGAGNIL